MNSDPVSGADPLGLCKIEIRFKPAAYVGWLGYYHAYVVTIDPNGSQQYFRGGPGSPDLSGIFGNIRTDYGNYAPGTKDWSTERRPSMTVYEDSEPCACENQRFKEIMDEINTAGIPYQPERWNSNATVGTMLRFSGFQVGALPVSAPSFNTNLFRSN